MTGDAPTADGWKPRAGHAAAGAAVIGLAAVIGEMTIEVIASTIAFLAVIAVIELAHRRDGRRPPGISTPLLLLDALYLAFATVLTGGPPSPLLFLMFLFVLAVTMLVSHRAGLWIASWCALLLVIGQAAARADLLASAEPADDLEVALASAGLVVLAVLSAAFSRMSERALRASREQLASLLDLTAELTRATTADDVACAIARCVTDGLGFTRAAVITGVDGWRMSRAIAGRPDVDQEGCRPPTGAEVEGIGSSGRVVSELDPEGSLAAALPDARVVAVVPLESEGRQLGLVVAEWGQGRDRTGGIPAASVSALTQASTRGAQALGYQTVVAEMARLATRDPLTGLANRRVFDGELRRELERARRTGEPLTLVLLDVDHFKLINDVSGHAMGDRVLQAIATALSSRTKGFDVVARVGGDEFAVLLPRCDAEFAPQVASRLRTDPGRGGAMHTTVTLSAGWATWPDHASDGAGLFAAADDALYKAKRSGRARVGSPDRYIDLTVDDADPAPTHDEAPRKQDWAKPA